MDFDFLSSNLQIAYPFTEDVTVGRHGADTELHALAASAKVRTVDQRDELLSVERIYVQSSSWPTTIEDAIIKLVWLPSGDIVELDKTAGTSQFSAYAYGSWIVIEWYAPNELSGEADIAVKLILPATVLENDGGFDYVEIEKSADDIILEASTLIQGPNKINRVYWKRGDVLELVADRGEELIVRAGFNMSIGQGEAVGGKREPTVVTIDAVPGAGLGKYLICRGSQYLITLNGVGANDHGELTIDPQECYWQTQELEEGIIPQVADHGITGTATLKPNEIQLNNSCGPCCSCDDYIATYQHLHSLWELAQEASAKIYEIADTYGGLIDLYNTITGGCTPIKLTLQQTATDQLIVTISLCNDTNIILNNDIGGPLLQFDLEFTFPSGVTGSYVIGSGMLQSTNGSNSREPDAYDATTATITSNLPVAQNGNLIWVGLWTLNGTLTGKELEVSVVAIEGELPAPRSASASITFA